MSANRAGHSSKFTQEITHTGGAGLLLSGLRLLQPGTGVDRPRQVDLPTAATASSVSDALQLETNATVGRRGKAAIANSLGVGLLFYHFTASYTRIRAPTGVLPAFYLLWMILAVLASTGLVVSGVDEVRLFDGYAGWSTRLTKLGILYLAFGYVPVLMAVGNLAGHYTRSRSPDERNRTAYILLGALIFLAGAATDFLFAHGLIFYALGVLAVVLRWDDCWSGVGPPATGVAVGFAPGDTLLHHRRARSRRLRGCIRPIQPVVPVPQRFCPSPGEHCGRDGVRHRSATPLEPVRRLDRPLV